MSLWCDLLVGSLLWAAIIGGLILVVRDCLKDRQLEATLLTHEEGDCCGCCDWGSVEIIPPDCDKT